MHPDLIEFAKLEMLGEIHIFDWHTVDLRKEDEETQELFSSRSTRTTEIVGFARDERSFSDPGFEKGIAASIDSCSERSVDDAELVDTPILAWVAPKPNMGKKNLNCCVGCMATNETHLVSESAKTVG